MSSSPRRWSGTFNRSGVKRQSEREKQQDLDELQNSVEEEIKDGPPSDETYRLLRQKGFTQEQIEDFLKPQDPEPA